MARFGDNPVYSPVKADAQIPFEDPTTGDDFKVTPEILTVFVQENMPIASGSTNGLINGSSLTKLNELYTKAQLDAIFTQLTQFPFPIFVASPVDGFIEIYRNVLSESVTFTSLWFGLTSGSTVVTFKIDGTPITGLTNIPVSASGGAIGTAANVLPAGSILGIEFAASGSPQNVRLTLLGKVNLT